MWEDLLDEVEKRPLIGHGYLAFWDAEKVEELGERSSGRFHTDIISTLTCCLTVDSVGLALFLAFLATLAFSAARIYSKYNVYGAAIPFGLVFVILLHGVGESLFKLPTFCGFIFYSQAACCLWLNERNEPVDESKDVIESGEIQSDLPHDELVGA